MREHFYELGLDPRPAVLDEGEARLLADETLEETLQEQYEGRDEFAAPVQSLIQTYGGARDEKIRSLVLRLHHYSQTRPDAEGWLAGQIEKFSATEPADWQKWLLTAIQDWHDEWLPVLENLGTPASGTARSFQTRRAGGRRSVRQMKKPLNCSEFCSAWEKTFPANLRRKFWSKSLPPTATGRQNGKAFFANR